MKSSAAYIVQAYEVLVQGEVQLLDGEVAAFPGQGAWLQGLEEVEVPDH